MISIRESIIGRKDISNTPILRQGDIIITRRDDIYMVLTDQKCLKKVLQPGSFEMYDMSKGAYVHSIGRDYVGFMNLSSFNSTVAIKFNGFLYTNAGSYIYLYTNMIKPINNEKLKPISSLSFQIEKSKNACILLYVNKLNA